jgi:dihydrodipicolinate synthase/N-acetylneuraminate lyase
MKSAMNLLTPINVGPVREPLKMLTQEQEKMVKEELKALKLI